MSVERMNAQKTVGTREAAGTPQDSVRTVFKLRRLALKTGAWKPVRGFVVKGRTHEDAEMLWTAMVLRRQSEE
jgi:hypothetical protein